MKNTRWTIMAALILAASSAAHAQGPVGTTGALPGGSAMGGPAMGGAPAGAATGGGAADTGSVSNAQTLDSTTTTTSSSGIAADGSMSGDSMSGDTSMTSGSGQLANTGGEPVLMSLVGLTMALGAFAIRKRVSA